MKISNETYDILKKVALVVIPALVTLVSAVTAIWGLPYGEAISATIGAVGIFLGSCLQVSTKEYNKEGGN